LPRVDSDPLRADQTSPPPQSRPGEPVPQAAKVIDSDALFRGSNEVRVRHGAEEYRLRITRQGKLILTK
jgi:hemin uptake protein HemP